VRYWMMGYRAANGRWNESTPEKADEVVGRLGTNVIATLLEMLRSSDSAWEIKFLPWSYKWRRLAQRQHLIKIAIGPHLKSYEVVEASRAFKKLGPQGKGAVPMLIKLYQQEELPISTRSVIPLILADIGPNAKEAIPVLLRNAGNSGSRGNAIYALGQIRGDPQLVVPELTTDLRDSDAYVRRCAAVGLKSFGAAAKEAVPALVDVLKGWALEQRLATKAVMNGPNTTQAFQDALNDPMVAAEALL
jgi:hypothetical protein